MVKNVKTGRDTGSQIDKKGEVNRISSIFSFVVSVVSFFGYLFWYD